MTRYLFLQIGSSKVRTQTHSSWHLLCKQLLYNCYKVYEDYIECDTKQAENVEKLRKTKKIVFQNNIGRKCRLV